MVRKGATGSDYTEDQKHCGLIYVGVFSDVWLVDLGIASDGCHTVDGSEIRLTTWDGAKTLQNIG